jgi:hypothetical protein
MDEFGSPEIQGGSQVMFSKQTQTYDFFSWQFKDKASYQANADSPKQHRHRIFRSYLTDDPQWNDGKFSATGPGTK